MSEVSRNAHPVNHRPPVRDRQTKIKGVVPSEAAKTRLARITIGADYAECSCGWIKVHARAKVAGDAAERHVNRRHEGRAIWL